MATDGNVKRLQVLGSFGVSVERVEALERQVADLLYQAITIPSFKATPSQAEKGAVIDAVALSWSTNKTPTALTLDGTAIDVSATSQNLTGLGLSGNKSWTLRATDERGTVASKNAGITFLNGVYYGVAAAPEAIDNAFVLGLQKTLTDTRKRTITVTAGDGHHVWYSLPVRLGACTFTVGGFEGGFDLVATQDFTNSQGYTESYYIYRSGQTGLGETKVVVS